MDTIVSLSGISKSFPGIKANDNISLELRPGEIHALLGENGAGKSTLMSILFGLYQPDEGTIAVRGRPVRIPNPNVANELGIGMVHQHFKLVHNFTVTENIVLGLEPRVGPVLTLRQARQRVADLSKTYGLDVDPDARIEDVSVGMQQRVEILKMLYRQAEVLIFDEPTAVLTPQEITELMQILRNLIREGKSILLITHKLKEIKAVADRCTVLRRGRVIGTVEVAGASEAQLAEMMVGRQVSFKVEKGPAQPGEEVLRVEGLQALSSRRLPALKGVGFTLRRGEILGVAGVEGNGQSELVEVLTGLRPAQAGRVWLKGADITRAAVRRRIESGLGHIPEDRQKRGLILDAPLEENLVLESYYKKPYAQGPWLQKGPIRAKAQELIAAFDVRSGQGPVGPARALSGGNQQKAILGREISLNPDVLIAVQPTRGLDVGSIEYIHKRLVEQRDAGRAVLLVSLELDEILDLSDRILVLHGGSAVGELKAAEATEQTLGLMMAGGSAAGSGAGAGGSHV